MYRGLLIGGLFAVCIYSVFDVMNRRAHLNELTAQKRALQDQLLLLRDENHSLKLEMATLTRYEKIRREAKASGMLEPSFADGTQFYLRGEER